MGKSPAMAGVHLSGGLSSFRPSPKLALVASLIAVAAGRERCPASTISASASG